MKKSINTYILTCVILALMVSLYPQKAQAQLRTALDVQEWPAGKVVLASGDTVYGPLTFHRNQDIINVQNEDGSLSSFSPVNVQYFIAQEQPSGRPYVFRSLMWDRGRENSDFKRPTFFEQLNQGTLTLIMRESYVRRDASRNSGRNSYYYDPSYYAMGSEWLDQVKELYYILLPDGEIITLRNIRRDLFDLFGDKARRVKKYARKHNLDYDKPHELVAIVNYFNSLLTQAAVSNRDAMNSNIIVHTDLEIR
ncbi:hypothetical protein CLV24_13720 [Pontibacter ummariensis]|uniref:DUF4294 domain-containing protein n=1 Tax=Pontibacter ummariensis TaxID=1610492 RepID=A0A239L7N8_9BACT|nr:hypothetical protein [Pontibacter ummariensis]PRY03993.1 hypothetical protein CLV24_13720 [Pontibacter ummariensis]SNT26626.1 hypothetical protein SAMN06296052_13721 [Pontibacter ummariensis]